MGTRKKISSILFLGLIYLLLIAAKEPDYYNFRKNVKDRGSKDTFRQTIQQKPVNQAVLTLKKYNINHNEPISMADQGRFVQDPNTGVVLNVANLKTQALQSSQTTSLPFSYDGAGNVLTDPDGKTYTYDAENNLISVKGENLDIEYVYSDGLRIQKINHLTRDITYFLWADINPTGYPQVLEELDKDKKVKIRYVYGKWIISRTEINGTSESVRYYNCDATGSVRSLTDEQGNVTDTYEYDAFGNMLNNTGSTDNNYLYQAEYYDKDIGMYYLRARYLKPEIGRFYSMDPDEGDKKVPKTQNKYPFVVNNPINLMDPSGETISVGMMAVSGLSLGILSSVVYTFLPNMGMEPICKFPGGFKSYLGRIDEIIFPLGIDVDENIKKSSKLSKWNWFLKIKPEGDWDFKKLYDNPLGKKGGRLSSFERAANLANFNFGATGPMVNLSNNTLLRGAGMAELLKFNFFNDSGYGLFNSPYGDDPQDQVWIKHGFRYINDWWVLK